MVDFNIKVKPFIKDFPGIFLLGWDVYIFKYLFLWKDLLKTSIYEKVFDKKFSIEPE